MDSFIEVTRDQTEVDAGRKILEALNGFPWPDTETHCKLSDMSAVQRRKFHKLHENVLIWKDDAAGGVLHIKATIPRGNGGIGDPTRQKLLRPPVTESEVLKAVLGVLDIPARLKGKSKRTQ